MNDFLPCPDCNSMNKNLTTEGEYYILRCEDCGFEVKVHTDFSFPHTILMVWNFNKRRIT